MRQQTILHTIETAGPGGAETVVLNLATRLDPQRFRSIALLPSNSWLGKKLAENGVRTYFAEDRAWYEFRLPRAIAKVIREENVALVHSHLPDQNFYSCLAGLITKRKTLVTYHGPVELSDARRLKSAAKLWLVRNSASAVVVVCDFVGKMIRDIGFPANKITRIYNGIDLERPLNTGRGGLRDELDLRNGTKLVGMVANVRRTKGYEYFIRAAEQVCKMNRQVRFVAVGDVDPQLGESMWQLLDELKLRDRVHFLGFREDIPQILGDLDVFVLSSTSEGFPLVTLEAMGAGKPVVATRCGGPAEVIDDGRTGFLVPVADADALATRISELLSAPERAAAVGANAQAKVNGEFTVERMIGQYEQLYERILSTG
jgi:glycosyltransferase involved in cell wall biosynthesis